MKYMLCEFLTGLSSTQLKLMTAERTMIYSAKNIVLEV